MPASELRRDLTSTLGLNPWVGNNSSPRAQMFASHLGQNLVVSGATRKRIKTGMEYEFGKYTFNVKAKEDISIIKTIQRYPETIGAKAINFNPQTLVIYEEINTNRIGIISLQKFCSYHQHFGFEYKEKSAIGSLYRGAQIPKDTIFMDSPRVTDDGDYMYGVELNMAFMSHPSVSEDGIMICEDVLDKFKFKTYETRIVEWGSKRFPLNLYGTPENYKPFPDIGDYVRDDGLLMVTRTYEKNLAPVEMSIFDVMRPDYISDRCTYANGKGGRVVDIKVNTGDSSLFENYSNMDTQVQKYLHSSRNFHLAIVDEWKRLKKERGNNLVTTPEFHRQVVESLVYIGEENETPRIIREHRKAPLDNYRVEFVIEYENIPREGFKFTDCHGGKGVICKIAKPEEMPVDEAGNRADIVMDGNSTVNRMNIGRAYELYYNAASRDVTKNIRNLLNVKDINHPKIYVEDIYYSNQQLFESAYRFLMGYYKILSPLMYEFFNKGRTDEEKINHIAAIVKDGIYIYMPPETSIEHVDAVLELEKHYKPIYGPVTYVGNSGNRVVTRNPVRIGSVYIMLLEKTGDDWSAVSSGKLQHFGILAQLTRADKNTQPVRTSPIRAIGESEGRIFVSYAGERAIAELMDRNNNPAAHKEIVKNILNAEKPTNIDKIIDRDVIHYGGSKPLSIVKHVLQCAGIKFIHHN